MPDELPGSSQMLLDAVMALSSDLDLHSVLARIVESATALTGARYGAAATTPWVTSSRPASRTSSTSRSASCPTGAASSAC